MRFRSAILWALLLSLIAGPAYAEKRIALVIGNKDYKSGVGALTNPLNDIRVVGDALRSVGFEVLKPVENATRDGMLSAIYGFASALKAAGPDAVGFLYYSGHGVASAGENYLIPVDVTEPSSERLRIQGVKQSEVLAILHDEAPNAAHYLVLDACRNTLKGARGAKGFVAVGQQNGVLVAFSTEPGSTASDIGDGSGPYAAALASELTKPGQTDLIMFHNVRIDVMDKTKSEQVPWTEDGIQRRERPVFARAPDFNKPVNAPPAVTTSNEAAQAWAAAKDTTSTVVLEAFIRRYGDGFYGDLARARLEELKKVDQPGQSESGSSNPNSQGTISTVLGWFSGSSPSSPGGPCGAALVSLSSRSPQPLSANEECALKPKDVFKECDKCPEMVVVPAGRFTMGSSEGEIERYDNEGPQHRVTISRPFAVGRFSVTFDEWDACVADGGCDNYKPSDLGWGRGWRPVINVSWDDAKSYIAWLSLKTGKTYRLPSESEREYVTRAGTTTPFWWGSSISTSQANYEGNYTYRNGAKGEYRQKTLPVDAFQANPWGLYQVHGNVWEWVEDCWHDSYAGAPADGSAWISGDCKDRVDRGGSWGFYPGNLRAASRGRLTADNRGYNIGVGFRLARTLTP
jgi:formylglycine-generating enzyme required for sulfatase activity